MNANRSKLFWLSVTAIALLSILVSFYNKNLNISTSIKSVFDQSGIYEFFSFLIQTFLHLHRWLTLSCDDTKWKSPLIAKYGVAAVLTVDQKGCGKFKTLQKAVDAVPEHAPKPTLIIVDAGTYKEKVEVKATKSNLILQGKGFQTTFLVWDDTANKTKGTPFSYSVGVFSPKFIAHDISFKNTAPPTSPGQLGGQAVALRIEGDQAAFYDCGFYGHQDTLFDSLGRHYFKHCFIEGSTDFIFGNGRSLYEDCTIHSVASGAGINGAIAAQQRASLQEKTGFSFVNCKIEGVGKIYLGRAWGVFSTTVFIKTTMPAIITPAGWNDWKDPSRDQKVFFGEHACTGPGSNFKGRVKFAKNLTVAEATPYMSIAYIDGKDWIH